MTTAIYWNWWRFIFILAIIYSLQCYNFIIKFNQFNFIESFLFLNWFLFSFLSNRNYCGNCGKTFSLCFYWSHLLLLILSVFRHKNIIGISCHHLYIDFSSKGSSVTFCKRSWDVIFYQFGFMEENITCLLVLLRVATTTKKSQDHLKTSNITWFLFLSFFFYVLRYT